MTDTKKLKRDIIKLLKSKKLYENTDLNLVEELCYQYELLNIAKEDIRTRGLMVNVRTSTDEPLLNLNQSISIINKCTRTIQSLYRQLAIAPQDRIKTKDVNGEETSFDVNEYLNE